MKILVFVLCQADGIWEGNSRWRLRSPGSERRGLCNFYESYPWGPVRNRQDLFGDHQAADESPYHLGMNPWNS